MQKYLQVITYTIGTPERAQCAIGVFNALAVAESGHSYGLSFNTSDPMRICRTQKTEYTNGCYAEMELALSASLSRRTHPATNTG